MFPTSIRRPAAACGLAFCLGFTNLAAAQETDPRIDPSTGRDVAVYPPDPLFDYRHMLLEINIPTMSEPKFDATETLTARAVGSPRAEMKLRAGPGLTFSTITVNGRTVPKAQNDKPGFFHADGVLTIPFPAACKPGENVTVVMSYKGDKAGGGGAGLTWSKDDPRTPEEDFLFHSQGQPESNHLWFPCHDFPNERLTTELIVTAPKGYEVVSNGHIVGLTRHTDGRTTFHWLQDLPHTTYLVMMAVGKFDIVNVAGNMTPRFGAASEGGKQTLSVTGVQVVGHDPARPNLWMPVYGPVGSGEAIRGIFGNTPEMVAYFEKLFDEPFPWDKYAQILVRDFAAGAMENTSATTFSPQFARGRRGTADSVISHELCHQWFGDLATYKSWQHLWLGEGWATMGEALWAEHQRGEDGYQAAIMSDFLRERAASRGSFPRSSGMTSNRYGNPQTRFMSSDNVYSKGGFILNMLRARLGDEAFFKGSALYLDRYHLACTETDDFRKCLEEVSGQSLERFFDQWVRRPGHPSIDVELTWDESNSTLRVKAAQTQTINADNPAYAFTLPIYVDTGNEHSNYVYLDMDGKAAEGVFHVSKKPADVSIDPYLTLLVNSKVTQPLAAWLRILENGPTLAAKLRAADALAEFTEPEARAALAAIAGNPGQNELLREIAADSLSVINASAALTNPKRERGLRSAPTESEMTSGAPR